LFCLSFSLLRSVQRRKNRGVVPKNPFFLFASDHVVSPSKPPAGGSKKKKRLGAPRKADAGARCVKCEAVMKGGMKFCNKCGAPQDTKVVEHEDEMDSEVIVVEETIEEEVVVKKKVDDAVFKAPAPVVKKASAAIPISASPLSPELQSRAKLIQVDEDGDEEEEDSTTNTPTNARLSKKTAKALNEKIENSPKRAVEVESSEEEPPSAVKREAVAEPKVFACLMCVCVWFV
jgi:hypothetical protein